MIRATHSIAARFDGVVKALEEMIKSEITLMWDKYSDILQRISDTFGKHANIVNTQTKQIASLSQIQKEDNKRLLGLIALYAELATCGVMDGKRKEALKAESHTLTNPE
jgi:hypothetical protein